ncbi:hypothetical protein [Mobiluncus mulieris]|nr:hypothetical protein [Mobiluncus mulieris]
MSWLLGVTSPGMLKRGESPARAGIPYVFDYVLVGNQETLHVRD